MKTPSGPPPKGTISWWGPLVTVSLFTFWNTPLFAQLTMESVPVNVAEGRAVLLLVHNLPENPYGYSWYKGGKVQISHQILAYRTQTQTITPGVAHSGRETIYPNGTLLFQNVTLRDTGTYTLQVLKKHFQRELVSGQFHVYRAVAKPRITANSTTVREHESVTFTCHESDAGVPIHWLFNGQSLRLSERMTWSQDKRLLIIRDVWGENAGSYQCEASNLVSVSRSDPVTLRVSTQGQAPGLSPGVIAGIVTGVLAGVAVVAALGCILFFTRTGGTCSHGDLGHQQSPSSNFSQGHSKISTSSALPTAAPIYEELLNPDTNIYCRIDPKVPGAP